MFFIAEYTSMITVSCLCSILFFGGWLSPFPASWTFTTYLPSLLLIPSGLWVIWDGLRYETIFGKLVLPAVGAVIVALGAAFLLFPNVNAFIQGPFWLLSKIFIFLFVYVWMRGTLPRFRYDRQCRAHRCGHPSVGQLDECSSDHFLCARGLVRRRRD